MAPQMPGYVYWLRLKTNDTSIKEGSVLQKRTPIAKIPFLERSRPTHDKNEKARDFWIVIKYTMTEKARESLKLHILLHTTYLVIFMQGYTLSRHAYKTTAELGINPPLLGLIQVLLVDCCSGKKKCSKAKCVQDHMESGSGWISSLSFQSSCYLDR